MSSKMKPTLQYLKKTKIRLSCQLLILHNRFVFHYYFLLDDFFIRTFVIVNRNESLIVMNCHSLQLTYMNGWYINCFMV